MPLKVSSGRTNENRQGKMSICNWNPLWTHDKGVSISVLFGHSVELINE